MLKDENDIKKAFAQADEDFKNKITLTLEELQRNGVKSRVGILRLRWKTAFAITAACLLFSTTVFAVVRNYIDRANVGGHEILKLADELEIDKRMEEDGVIRVKTMYRSQLAKENLRKAHWPDRSLVELSSETAGELIRLLDGMVFTSSGEKFQLILPGSDESVYYSYYGDETIYDKDGNAIYDLAYSVDNEGNPSEIFIMTISDSERFLANNNIFDYNSGYEEAVALLGQDFRLPVTYTEGFEEPRFNLVDNITMYGIRKAAYGVMDGDPGMNFIVEIPGGSAPAWYTAGLIEEINIADTVVYKIIDELSTQYVWEYDGLMYRFTQDTANPVAFTDTECEEIVASMIK